MMKESKPKSKKVPKDSSKNTESAKKADNFKPSKNKEINDLFKGALHEYIEAQNANQRFTKRNIEALMSVVQEFLNSFIILGYTTDGKPVEVIYSHNSQEAGALTTLINKFFDRAGGDIEESID